METKKILLALLFILIPVFAESASLSIPASRVVTWENNVGVPGGIPTKVCDSSGGADCCTTAACNTVRNAAHPTSAQISSAISGAPSGTVVYIPAGTHSMSGDITISRSNVVVRGAGMNSTILTGGSIHAAGGSTQWTRSTCNPAISSGYTKGSTTLTFASSSAISCISAGQGIIVYQNDDTFMHSYATFGTGKLLTVQAYVVAKNGASLTIDPPLPYEFTAGLSPKVMLNVTTYKTNIGLENMTFDRSGLTEVYGQELSLEGCYSSWVKNVWYKNWSYQGLTFYANARCTIHGVWSTSGNNTQSNEGYGIVIGAWENDGPLGGNSGILIENNVVYGSASYNMFAATDLKNATGCVIAYNYLRDTWTNAVNVPTPAGMISHSYGTFTNLWEGNVSNSISSDSYHGCSAYQTLFRNYLDGLHVKGAGYKISSLVGARRWADYYNVVGNVLGASTSAYGAYEASTTSPPANAIYALGYTTETGFGCGSAYVDNPTCHNDPDSCPCDSRPRATILRHRNYDNYTNSVTTCGDARNTEGCQSATGNDLPNSMYLASKPTWMCNETSWPPVNPDGANDAARYSKIPAQIAVESGTCTLSGGGDTTPVLGGGITTNGVSAY
jgi:hypothetical protein